MLILRHSAQVSYLQTTIMAAQVCGWRIWRALTLQLYSNCINSPFYNHHGLLSILHLGSTPEVGRIGAIYSRHDGTVELSSLLSEQDEDLSLQISPSLSEKCLTIADPKSQ